MTDPSGSDENSGEPIDLAIQGELDDIDSDERQIWGCLTMVVGGYLVLAYSFLSGLGLFAGSWSAVVMAIYLLPLTFITIRIWRRGSLKLPNGETLDGKIVKQFCALLVLINVAMIAARF
ncbi:MAG: hypothetical protein AAGE37_04770 [Pseudomonadota bacterium]